MLNLHQNKTCKSEERKVNNDGTFLLKSLDSFRRDKSKQLKTLKNMTKHNKAIKVIPFQQQTKLKITSIEKS